MVGFHDRPWRTLYLNFSHQCMSAGMSWGSRRGLCRHRSHRRDWWLMPPSSSAEGEAPHMPERYRMFIYIFFTLTVNHGLCSTTIDVKIDFFFLYKTTAPTAAAQLPTPRCLWGLVSCYPSRKASDKGAGSRGRIYGATTTTGGGFSTSCGYSIFSVSAYNGASHIMVYFKWAMFG